MDRIYLDYAATTPVDPDVITAMTPYFHEHFGNASSPHSMGREANKAIEDARANVAEFVGAQAGELIFNSGATEGANHTIYGVAQSLRGIGRHIVVSAIEHHAVLEPIEYLQTQGYRVTFVPVDANGMVSPKGIESNLTDQTILVAVMHASNEIGTVQPIADIARITQSKKIPLLVDACQTAGHIPVDVNELGADLLCFSAHKFYGPKGVGALYIRPNTPIEKFIRGGDQERNRRASTQNVAGIVGMSKAVDLCRQGMLEEANLHRELGNYLMTEVPNIIEGVRVNGHRQQRLPNNVHFSFAELEGESLLMALDMQNICASMGSACTSGAMEPSHVLRAIGLPDELAYGSLRITLGRWSTREHIDRLLEVLPKIVQGLRI